MGKFAPVFLAFLLNSFGVNIFRENTPGCEPLISCLIFLLSVFIFLWDVRLYPSSLRKLSSRLNCLLEFLLADFIMEHIMGDFWFPLEASMASFLPKLSEFERDLLKQSGWDSGGIFSSLAYDGAVVAFSYVLSLFFLFSVMHATRIVDFRLLTCGVGVFFKDVLCRFKKFRKTIFKFWGTKKANKLTVNCKSRSKSSKTLTSTNSSDFDICNDYLESDDNFSDSDSLRSFGVSRKF